MSWRHEVSFGRFARLVSKSVVSGRDCWCLAIISVRCLLSRVGVRPILNFCLKSGGRLHCLPLVVPG